MKPAPVLVNEGQAGRAMAHFELDCARWDALTPRAQAALVLCTPPVAPRRAVRLTLDLQADTREELVGVLGDFANRIAVGEATSGVCGAQSHGYIYEYTEAKDPRRDVYFDRVRAYLDVSVRARQC